MSHITNSNDPIKSQVEHGLKVIASVHSVFSCSRIIFVASVRPRWVQVQSELKAKVSCNGNFTCSQPRGVL